MRPCSLLSLATAVPPHVDRAGRSQGDRRARAFGGKKRCSTACRACSTMPAIARRHLVAPPEWYEQPHGWAERNAVYLEAAEKLFVEAARQRSSKPA